MTKSLDQVNHIVGLLSPVDIVAVATASDIVSMKKYTACQFAVYFGTITTAAVTVTVEACTDVTPSATSAIAFNYRLTSAVGTDSVGAITAATSSGVSIGVTDDDKVLLIDIVGSELTADYPYVRVKVTPGGTTSACEVAVMALLTPRYAQYTPISAVV